MSIRSSAYLLFLQTPFWRELAAEQKRLFPECKRCGSRSRLQAHHHRYPRSWFDSSLADLETLCALCHRQHHGIGMVSFECDVADEVPVSIYQTMNVYLERVRKKKRQVNARMGRSIAAWLAQYPADEGLRFQVGKLWEAAKLA